MGWTIDISLRRLVNPRVAQTFRVLPIFRDDNALHLVTDLAFSKAEWEKFETSVSFHLALPVKLHALAECPDIDTDAFARELLQWHSVQTPTSLSQPVSADLLTVLLVDDDPSRAKRTRLEMSADGLEVSYVKTLEDAIAFLEQSTRQTNQIVLMDDFPGDREATLRELKAHAPFAAVVDGAAQMADVQCSLARCSSTSS